MAKQLIDRRISVLKGGLLAVVLAGVGLFAGCGDGGSSSGSNSPKKEASIGGLVNDVKGPVSHGQIEVKDSGGSVVAKGEFHDGKYHIKVPATASYPVLLIAHPPQDAVLNAPIRAVVTSSIADHVDISSVSEAIVDGALTLGGLTMQNIAKASGGAIGMRQSQGVSAGTGGSGGGPGNSGGGTGRGGHGGHNMEDMRGTVVQPANEGQPQQ